MGGLIPSLARAEDKDFSCNPAIIEGHPVDPVERHVSHAPAMQVLSAGSLQILCA